MTYDFSKAPDYSREEYPPHTMTIDFESIEEKLKAVRDGAANLNERFLHNTCRTLSFHDPKKRNLVVGILICWYSASYHRGMLETFSKEIFSVHRREKTMLSIYGNWIGQDDSGKMKILSSGSESLCIDANEEMDVAIVSDQVLVAKLELIMPLMKSLGVSAIQVR